MDPLGGTRGVARRSDSNPNSFGLNQLYRLSDARKGHLRARAIVRVLLILVPLDLCKRVSELGVNRSVLKLGLPVDAGSSKTERAGVLGEVDGGSGTELLEAAEEAEEEADQGFIGLAEVDGGVRDFEGAVAECAAEIEALFGRHAL